MKPGFQWVEGVTWTQVIASEQFDSRNYYSCRVYDDKLRNIGGVKGTQVHIDVWWTSDGQNWQQEAASVDFINDQPMVVSAAVRIRAINGQTKEVWCSKKGADWTQATSQAAFSPRIGFGLITLDDKLWLIGSSQYTNFFQDVLCSTNGATWSLVTAQTPFTAHVGNAIALKGKSCVFSDHNWYSHKDPINEAMDCMLYSSIQIEKIAMVDQIKLVGSEGMK